MRNFTPKILIIIAIQSLYYIFLPQHNDTNWKIFHSEDKRFSVQLPRTPSILTDPKGDGEAMKEWFPLTKQVAIYDFSAKEDEEWGQHIFEFLLSTEKLSADEFYERCEGNLLWFDGDDKKIKYQKRSTQGKALIFDAEYSKFEMTGRMRIIKHKDSIFIIRFGTRSKKGNDPKLIARVLNTFKLH